MAVAVLVGVVVAVTGVTPYGLGDAALAQSEQECWQWTRPIVGVDEDGNPQYGAERLENVCRSGGGGSAGSGPHTCQHEELGTVDCTHAVHGWWNNSEQCYVRLMSPQPSPGSAEWEGNDPADGAVYLLACPVTSIDDLRVSPAFRTQAPDLPSPAVLAQRAIESLPLVGAQIGIAPDPEGIGLVGVPVWLWTENTEDTWGPVTRSVSVPGLTVTARGQATQIEWDMGDGTTEVCEGPGTPYQAEFGGQEPECGHIYTHPSQSQPDGRYHITATTNWQVEWWVEPQGSGASGEDGFFRESSTSVQINELQVVTS